MNGRYLSFLFVVMLVSMPVLADSERTPLAKVFISEAGDHIFKMIPARWRKKGESYEIEREAFGIAYAINQEGEFKEIWKTKGWYTFEGEISRDGRYFVRMGPWASDQEKHTDLAIAFYDRGKLLKKYRVNELVKKPELLEDTVSHYDWRPRTQSEPSGIKNVTDETFQSVEIFHLVMIDKTTYNFDIKTGEILESGIDDAAESYTELWAKEQKAANLKGLSLYETSTFKKDYDKYFSLSQIEADQMKASGVYFEGEEWSATLTPKKKYQHSCKISVVYPIGRDGEIETSIKAQGMNAALEKALRHPFISKRFKEAGATGIRLRVTGDRLHWDTPTLQAYLGRLKVKVPEGSSLRHWAYLIIDAKEPRYFPLYLNTETGNLIYGDESKKGFLDDSAGWTYEPIFIGADGDVVPKGE